MLCANCATIVDVTKSRGILKKYCNSACRARWVRKTRKAGRICTICGKSAKVGLLCRACQKRRSGKAKTTRALYPERHRIYNQMRERNNRDFVDSLKRKPCMDCGLTFPPCCMDFDHRDPSLKIAPVGRLVATASRQRLLAEIAKCDLVCSNCHRLRTFLK